MDKNDKRITEVTYQEIVDIIAEGFSALDDEMGFYGEESRIFFHFSGRLTVVAFLNRLYDLNNMPSYDDRFDNAFEEINYRCKQEFSSVNWIFEDERFLLSTYDSDEYLLRFLCEMFHPAVRDERTPWKAYIERINELLKYDGYEIYASSVISGRNVYSYRTYLGEVDSFSEEKLFTNRYDEFINIKGSYEDKISDCVTEKIKKKLSKTIFEFNEPQKIRVNRYDSWEENSCAVDEAIKRLNEFFGYPIIDLRGCLWNQKEDECLAYQFTPLIFDLIELQNDELSATEKGPYQEEINRIFQQGKMPFRLTDRGLIERIVDNEVLSSEIINRINQINEPGVKQLLEIAIEKHMQPNVQDKKDAVEKIWDAFERVKTVCPGDKKHSLEELLKRASGGEENVYKLLNNEFYELTNIGNNYRIRHHETDKIEIIDLNYYEYFFNRCLSILSLVIQYL